MPDLSQLAELTQVHDEILGAITRLEAEVAREVPDRAALATARWRLRQASGRRRRMLDQEIYPAIERRNDGGGQGFRDLRAADAAAIAYSSQHIADWSIEDIVRDWPGYRVASGAMTESMRQRVTLEKSILYPLIGITDGNFTNNL